jgi:hypothetical protein
LEVFADVGFRVQRPRPRDQNLFGFDVVRIGDAAIDGADRRTGFVIVETHTFRTQERVDDIDRISLPNGIVRALRLARPAVDAIAGNRRRHEKKT